VLQRPSDFRLIDRQDVKREVDSGIQDSGGAPLLLACGGPGPNQAGEDIGEPSLGIDAGSFLAVSMSEARMAQFSAPSSWPAKRAKHRLR